jgi:putative ABC transport system ATP-binding protein
MTAYDTLHIRNLAFGYQNQKPVLDIPSFNIKKGEHVFLHGPSGSGKTTFLGLATGILTATRGEIRILGTDITQIPTHQRDSFRGEHIGYIFQMFNLIPYLDVLENITLPCYLNDQRRRRLKGSIEAEAETLARRLGLVDLLQKKVTALSVGQQQRVAAARALIGGPPLIIADEPTSALDTDQREAFLKLLFEEVDRSQGSILFVSHDLSLKPLFHRTEELQKLNRIGTKPEDAVCTP